MTSAGSLESRLARSPAVLASRVVVTSSRGIRSMTPIQRAAVLLCLPLLAASLASCNRTKPKSDQELAAERDKEMAPYKAPATAKVAAVEKLGAAMKKVPRLTKDEVKLDAGPVSIDEPQRQASVTAGLIHEADLVDVSTLQDTGYYALPRMGLFASCKLLLSGKGGAADHLKVGVIKNCASVKYAIVIRTLKKTLPEIDLATKRYSEGTVAGEVHAFNIDSGKHLGGFRFSAVNSDTVQFRGDNPTFEVKDDFTKEIGKAVDAGIAKHMR